MGANYGIGAAQFHEIIGKKASNEQTAADVLEVQNLKREVNRLSMRELELSVELAYKQSKLNEANETLNAEREAHNKLKALCHERGFGTPPFYTPPKLSNIKRKLPSWSVEFSTKYNGDITVLFDDAPSSERINKMKERLDATHWIITYNGFTCHD